MTHHGEAAGDTRWGPPYLLYLGGAADDLAIKTARGLAYWRPEWCVGQHRRPDCNQTLGLADMTPAQAKTAGADTMVVGTANAGGVMAPETVADVVAALDAGLNVIAGLHQKLRDNADIVAAAKRNGRVLFDARESNRKLPVGNGRKRAGRRLLTVGTDCSVGKMYTTLALERSMRNRGLAADLRATGQTGIFIAGDGIPVDAVISDFISGAAELISPATSSITAAFSSRFMSSFLQEKTRTIGGHRRRARERRVEAPPVPGFRATRAPPEVSGFVSFALQLTQLQAPPRCPASGRGRP